MNDAQGFSLEMLGQMFIQSSKKQSEMFDLLQLLMMSAEDSETDRARITEQLGIVTTDVAEIKKTTGEISGKIDQILESLSRLESDFKDLKSESRELEQKLTLMNSKLVKIEQIVDADELEDYYALAQSLYANWEELDSLTRKFIPLAEYLFSKLQKYDKPDYSPVILELCRAIENEFLLKIFRKYTLDIISRYPNRNRLYDFLSTDQSYLSRETGVFAKAVIKAHRTGKPEYTLGQMNTIMSLMNNRSIVAQSPLLQDFDSYLQSKTVQEDLLDTTFIQGINRIVNDYRNPSAHPEFMTVEKAQECKDIMPEKLDYLMDCVRVARA